MIIDSHSHIGNEKFNKRDEIKIEDYIEFIDKVGIDMGLIMPVPCPIVPKNFFDFPEGKIILTWKYIDGKHKFFSDIDKINLRDLQNPYKEVNEYYYNLIKKSELEHRMHFIPIIHPILDTDEYLEQLIDNYDPIALKIHSVGTACSPIEIRKSYTNIIKKNNIPIIVHTDYNNGYFDNNIGLYNAVKKADACIWFDYFESNQIYGTLNHGATLNLEVFNKVNNSKFVKIGIEPSIYFGGNYGRLNVDKNIYDELGFLKTLKKYLSPSKIIFDVDFDYNRKTEELVDYNVVSRIYNIWNDNDSEKILSLNSLEQYPKLNKIIRSDYK